MGYREEYAALLEGIAGEAEAIAMRYFRTDGMRIDKKQDGSAVTQADRGVEEMARKKVAASGLKMDVLGEEMGGENAKEPAKNGRPRLIIDPIDGTEEFSRGIATFGTLLAIERDGDIVAGIATAPALAARWWAYRGEGAWRNGKRIHVSNVERLSDGMAFTGGTGLNRRREKIEKMRRLLDTARHGRSLGGFWQHMLVAEGATEAALDLHSKAWDLAPLALIVEEAGGRATDVNGNRSIYSGNLVSTNGRIHDEVLALLQ
ncbi:MAG TPA: inositol monophosphatase family protein [Candidatus Methylomirabilis sp.]|nr:inositol monophosphatase family protein [Candidatus Methylomirabilis sp.]